MSAARTKQRSAMIDDVLAAVKGAPLQDAVDCCLIVACGIMVQTCQRPDLPVMRDKLFKRLRDLTDSMAGDLEKMR